MAQETAPLEPQPGASPRDWRLVLNVLTAGIAVIPIGLLAFIVAKRISYPFELEWLEGDEFHHAWRILHGRDWYPAPSLDFVPNVYPPLYPWTCAQLMRVFGESLPVMRAVSATATAACLIAMFLIVARESGSRWAGVIAPGLFAATFAACGSWFDVARVDMLALALVLFGLYLARDESGSRSFIAGIGALALACLVKQTSLAFLMGGLAVWAGWNRRRALFAGGASILLLAGAVLWLQHQTAGWFLFYTWRLASSAPLLKDRASQFLVGDFYRYCGWLLPLVAAAAFVAQQRRKRSLILLMLPLALAASLAGRLHQGGYENDLIPAACFTSMCAALGFAAALRAKSPALPLAAAALVTARLWTLRYDVEARIPSDRDVAAGESVVQRVRDVPGDVLAPYNPYLLHLAGKPMHANFHVFNELAPAHERVPDLEARLARAVDDSRWTALVGAEIRRVGPSHTPVDTELSEEFVLTTRLIAADDQRTLYPLTGLAIRPAYLWVRR